MYFLLNSPMKTDVPNPLREWLPDSAWFAGQKLIELEGFEPFAQNMEKDYPNKFKEWYNNPAPEDEKLPGDWRSLEQQIFKKMMVVRVLRPDRITTCLTNFIEKTLPNGSNYTECDSTASPFDILYFSYLDSTPATPIYFILSPGANPVEDIEKLAKSRPALNPLTRCCAR
jgi:dynein heavy chain